jgi:hypothetical protein
MNKFKIAAIAAVVVVSCYFGYKSVRPAHEFSATEIENIEALANDEQTGSSDCNYRNGYMAFTGEKGGAYNCCRVWINSAPYYPEGHCY